MASDQWFSFGVESFPRIAYGKQTRRSRIGGFLLPRGDLLSDLGLLFKVVVDPAGKPSDAILVLGIRLIDGRTEE
jgi:hypothetical protein